jgi:hypothetical protein
MFQLSAFQRSGFQIGYATAPTDNGWMGGPIDDRWSYQTDFQKSKIKKVKTELQKVDSVLEEYERRKALAAENKLLAEAKRAAELAQQELYLITEINRLRMVRAELMQRIQEEEFILLLMMGKRRLRAV